MSIIVVGSAAAYEQPGSPDFDFGDKLTCRRLFIGPAAAVGNLVAGKGATMAVTMPKLGSVTMKYESCKVTSRRLDGPWTIEIMLSGAAPGQDPPASDPEFTPQQADLAVEKNPIWRAKFETLNGQKVARNIEFMLGKDTAEIEAKVSQADRDEIANDADYAKVLKLRMNGVHVYAIWPPTLTVVSYHASQPTLVEGGNTEVPDVSGIITLPTGLTWVRCGDGCKHNGTWWVLTRRWLCGPQVNLDLYPAAT